MMQRFVPIVMAAGMLLVACGGGGSATASVSPASSAAAPAPASTSAKPSAAASSAPASAAASTSPSTAASSSAAAASPSASGAASSASSSGSAAASPSASVATASGPAPAASLSYDTSAKLSVPVPDEVKSKGKLAVGIKCDYPPFGFIGADGKNAGFEIDLVHQIAQFAFGNPDAVQMECVNASNRIPYLTTNRVDLVIATITYTAERAKTINFSDPYFSASGRMLEMKSSNLSTETQLKTVSTTKGSVYVTYFQKCQPNTQVLQFEQTSEGEAAMLQGRAEAYVMDDTLLVDLASKNQNLKLVGPGVAPGPWGMGIRLNDKPMTDWVNAAIKQMAQDDFFDKDLKRWVTDQAAVAGFEKVIPRPNQTLSYPTTDQIQCLSSSGSPAASS